MFTRRLMQYMEREHAKHLLKTRFYSNRPRSIYQYSNMALRLSGQTSIFDVVFFVFESLLGIERQKKLKKFTILTRKPRSHVRILIYQTWPITCTLLVIVTTILKVVRNLFQTFSLHVDSWIWFRYQMFVHA